MHIRNESSVTRNTRHSKLNNFESNINSNAVSFNIPHSNDITIDKNDHSNNTNTHKSNKTVKIVENITNKEPQNEHQQVAPKGVYIDLEKKKQLLDEKLRQQKMNKQMQEVAFPSIGDRVKTLDAHFNHTQTLSQQTEEPQSLTQEASEIDDRKPIIQKKKKKMMQFKESETNVRKF